MTFKCALCGEDRDLSEFYVNDRKCKECRKEMVRQHRLANIDSVRSYDRVRGRTEERKAIVRARAPKYADRGYNREWRKKNPEKYKAHTAVNNAVRDGRLTKGDCEVCGSGKVHAHHEDYDKPLEVRWLCVDHHMAEHRMDP